MKLRRNGWIARLYFSLLRATGDRWRVERELECGTDLCTVVRTIVGVPLLFLLAAVLILLAAATIITFAGLLSVALYTIFHGVTGAALFVISAVTLIVAWVKSDGAAETREVVGEWVRAKKGRYCPRVEFTESPAERPGARP